MSSRQIYRSSSGDTWDLLKVGDDLFVVHTPNLASGGAVERYDLSTFLSREPHTAQNVALVRMIGGLLDQTVGVAA